MGEETKAMAIKCGEYGLVIIKKGRFKGQVGVYDDDTNIYEAGSHADRFWADKKACQECARRATDPDADADEFCAAHEAKWVAGSRAVVYPKTTYIDDYITVKYSDLDMAPPDQIKVEVLQKNNGDVECAVIDQGAAHNLLASIQKKARTKRS